MIDTPELLRLIQAKIEECEESMDDVSRYEASGPVLIAKLTGQMIGLREAASLLSELDPPSPSEVLTLAADIIERDGWVQEAFLDRDGRRCAGGAISCAAKDLVPYDSNRVRGRLRRDAMNMLTYEVQQTWKGQDDVFDWNDTKGRTQRQVVDTLRRAASR